MVKVNVLEIKCLRSLVGVLRIDRVRNEEVRSRSGIERGLASRADQRVVMQKNVLFCIYLFFIFSDLLKR